MTATVYTDPKRDTAMNPTNPRDVAVGADPRQNESMRRPTVIALVVVVLAALLAVGCYYRGALTGVLPSAAAEPGDITLPPGFRITVYAADVPNARQMAAGPDGIVFVGSRSAGKVYAVVDRNGDYRADQVHVLASGLNQPSGVATALSTSRR
jgi:glucose/arabinose dehydrogenase